MSDWDVLGTPEPENSGDQENDAVDGIYFADEGDSDPFGTPGGNQADDDNDEYSKSHMRNEAQSFNPRMCNPSKGKDLLDAGDDSFSNKKEHHAKIYQPPQNPYQNAYSSYTNRKIHDSPKYRGGHSRSRMTSDSDSAPFFIPPELLEDSFDEKVYVDFHDAALQQRAELGIGKSTEMNSLYYFWCFYLRTNFDQAMYDEFLDIAKQDAAQKFHYGIECYFRMCSYGLEKRWDPKVFAQFQEEAILDYKNGSTYGIEKIKGFLEFQKYDFEITVMPETQEILSKFPTYESFKQQRKNEQKRPLFNFEPRSTPKHSDASEWQPTNSPQNRQKNHPRGGNNRQKGNQNRNKQFRHKYDEPRTWSFGKMQPSSAPKPNNMNLQ